MTSMAVDMWAYCRVIEKEWKICGEDTLDLPPITDPKSPWYGFIPITPVMDVQLDQIVIRDVLQPLRTKLVTKFQETIENYRPDTWFDCYFTIFMVLNHMEMAAAHGNRFSKSHGLGVSSPRCPLLPRPLSPLSPIVKWLANQPIWGHSDGTLT